MINNNIKILEKITDTNIKYLIDLINKKDLNKEIINKLLNDLDKLVLYLTNKIQKQKIENYIQNLKLLKIQEENEKQTELEK